MLISPVALVAERADDRIVGHRGAADQRLRQAERARLLGEFDRVRPGQHFAHHVGAGNLRDIGRIIGRVQRRPQLLHDLAAIGLEHTLKAADLLVAECEVVAHGDGALELHLVGT